MLPCISAWETRSFEFIPQLGSSSCRLKRPRGGKTAKFEEILSCLLRFVKSYEIGQNECKLPQPKPTTMDTRDPKLKGTFQIPQSLAYGMLYGPANAKYRLPLGTWEEGQLMCMSPVEIRESRGDWSHMVIYADGSINNRSYDVILIAKQVVPKELVEFEYLLTPAKPDMVHDMD